MRGKPSRIKRVRMKGRTRLGGDRKSAMVRREKTKDDKTEEMSYKKKREQGKYTVSKGK